jgi:hypothetical protein
MGHQYLCLDLSHWTQKEPPLTYVQDQQKVDPDEPIISPHQPSSQCCSPIPCTLTAARVTVKWVTPSAYSLSTVILFPLWLLILGVAWIQLSPPLLAPNINNHPQTAPAAFLSQLFPIRLLILISLLFHQSRFPQQPCCLFTLCWWPFGPSSILLASEHDKIIVNINLPGKLWNASLYWFNYHLSQYEFLKYHGSVILKQPVFCSSMKCPMQCIRYFFLWWVVGLSSRFCFAISCL